MANESTPEARLKKYKEELAKMALSEGKQIKSSSPIQSQKPANGSTIDSVRPTTTTAPPKENVRPPQMLVSPSKRELREPLVSSRKKKGDEVRTTSKSKASRNRIMMKAREKAIDGQLQDVKDRKALLELHLEKKKITKDEYDTEMKALVEEGQNLLREKAELDRNLAG